MVLGLENKEKDIAVHIKTPLAVDNTANGVLSSLFSFKRGTDQLPFVAFPRTFQCDIHHIQRGVPELKGGVTSFRYHQNIFLK